MTSDHDQHAIADLLDFWFAEETKARWWQSTSKFDEICRGRFGHLVEQAASDRLDAWQETAEGALALCLLLDQMPRNLFRGTPKAFGTDAKAVAVAASAVDRGLDQTLTTEHRKFLYMPFMHSESLAEQERSIALTKSLDDDNTLHHAEEHADVIRRFGRFPHRNDVLGRSSTAEEEAFLADGAKTYGQTQSGRDE